MNVAPDKIMGIHFSPNGRRLIAGYHSGTVGVWDIPTGKIIAELNQGPWAHILTLDLDQAGRHMAVGVDRDLVNIWRIDDWSTANGFHLEKALGSGFIPPIRSVKFAPQSDKLFIRSDDAHISVFGGAWRQIWREAIPEAQGGGCFEEDCLAFRWDGRVFAMSDSTTDLCFYLDSNGKTFSKQVRIRLAEGIRGALFSSNGRVLAIRTLSGIYLADPLAIVNEPSSLQKR